MKSLLIALSLTLVVTGSCKKEDKLSATQLLTRANWKLVEYIQRIEGGAEENIFPDYPACKQDDIWSFIADNTYEIREGISKCDSDDVDLVQAGSWELLPGDTAIKINNDELIIEKLAKDRFTISFAHIEGGQSIYKRLGFTH